MPNNLTALKRQIEILTMFYPMRQDSNCTIHKLAEKYNVSSITINRDLKQLRSMGIPINSIYGSGVDISGMVNPNIISDLLVKYISIFHSEILIDYGLKTIISENNITKIYNLPNIASAIDSKVFVHIQYRLNSDNVIDIRVLPCKIIHNKTEYEFIGIRNDIVESYKFSEIIAVKLTSDKDKKDYNLRVNEFLNKYLENDSKIKIKIEVRQGFNTANFKISNLIPSKDNDNVIEFDIFHSSIEFVAKWVIEQYGKVIVIEPQVIRDKIRELAQSALNTYDEYSYVLNPDNLKLPELKLSDILAPELRNNKRKKIKPILSDISVPADLKQSLVKNEYEKETTVANDKNIDINKIKEKTKDKLDKKNKAKGKSYPDDKTISAYDYCSIPNRRVHAFEPIVLNLDVKDLYSYEPPKPSLLKRIFNYLK